MLMYHKVNNVKQFEFTCYQPECVNKWVSQKQCFNPLPFLLGKKIKKTKNDLRAMKRILYDMGNFFFNHNQILRPYNYVISGWYPYRTSALDPPWSLLWGGGWLWGGGIFFVKLQPKPKAKARSWLCFPPVTITTITITTTITPT